MTDATTLQPATLQLVGTTNVSPPPIIQSCQGTSLLFCSFIYTTGFISPLWFPSASTRQAISNP